MTDHDDTIEELDRLLRATKPAYATLRHEGQLSKNTKVLKPARRVGSLAVAASLVGALVVALAVLPPTKAPNRSETRLVIPSISTDQLSLRPKGRLTSPSHGKLPSGLHLPGRPKPSKG